MSMSFNTICTVDKISFSLSDEEIEEKNEFSPSLTDVDAKTDTISKKILGKRNRDTFEELKKKDPNVEFEIDLQSESDNSTSSQLDFEIAELIKDFAELEIQQLKVNNLIDSKENFLIAFDLVKKLSSDLSKGKEGQEKERIEAFFQKAIFLMQGLLESNSFASHFIGMSYCSLILAESKNEKEIADPSQWVVDFTSACLEHILNYCKAEHFTCKDESEAKYLFQCLINTKKELNLDGWGEL